MRTPIDLAEQGLVPDPVLRVAIQQLVRLRLRQERQKDKTNKAENGEGVEGALGPGGLRGRVFGAAHGETEGGTPGPGGRLDRRGPRGRARWTCLTLSVNQPEAARAGRWWVGG